MQIDKKIVKVSIGEKEKEKENKKIEKRPEQLLGSTYKIKTPMSEHALYITINNLDGKPFEMFINSKNMEDFQWIVALTRCVSAVFRKGGDSSFLVEELRSVFDPKGGYFKKGGKYMPSLVAEIGDVLDLHLKGINGVESKSYPEHATFCRKCGEKAVVLLDNCPNCLACGDGKCS